MGPLAWVLLFFRIALVALIVVLPTTWYLKVLILCATQAFLMFGVAPLLIPRLGYTKAPLPAQLGPRLTAEVKKLKGTPENVLKKSYDAVTTTFYGSHDILHSYFDNLFWHNHEQRWARGGKAFCNTQNHFLRLLLVKSGKFRDEDIELINVNYGLLNIHQIMRIHTPKGLIYADPWAHFKGVPLGQKVDTAISELYNPTQYNGLYHEPKTHFLSMKAPQLAKNPVPVSR